MMISVNTKQRDTEIEAAWAMHKMVLHDAAFDGLAALLTILLGIFSLIHAAARIVYGLVGMTVWAMGLWLIFLQWAHAWCDAHHSKSYTSSYQKKEDQADE